MVSSAVAATRSPRPVALPRIDAARCTACGRCESACPTGAIRLDRRRSKAGRPRVVVDAAACTYCTECEAACPDLAISCPFVVVLEGAPT